MLLAEELLLLLLDDETGRMSGTSAMSVDTAIGGAVLIDLTLAGRIGVEAREPGSKPDRLAVLSTVPTGDPLLDEVLARLTEKDGTVASNAVHSAYRGARKALTERLIDAGILGEERRRVLGIFPSRTLPPADPEPERALRARVDNVIAGRAPVDERTGALLALLSSSGLLLEAFPQPDRAAGKEFRRRVDQVATGTWATAATKEVADSARMLATVIMPAVIVPAVISGGS